MIYLSILWGRANLDFKLAVFVLMFWTIVIPATGGL